MEAAAVSKVVLLLAAYLLGAVPTGLLLVLVLRRQDIRKVGSGNIGATNVIRAAGWGLGLLTLCLDALKGAVVPAAFTLMEFPSDSERLAWQVGAAVLVLAGNIFNPFLRFRGGKGVGTGIGIAAVIAPVPLSFALAAFAAGFGSTRIVSIGSIAAGLTFAVAGPALYIWRDPAPPMGWPAFCVAVGLLVLLTHRSNIRRLLRGEESRLTRSD